ncbi:hypothetical protein ACOMHN_000065 [Nucella lapillus]
MLKKMVNRVYATTHPASPCSRLGRSREVTAVSDLPALIFVQMDDHVEDLLGAAESFQDLPPVLSAHRVKRFR